MHFLILLVVQAVMPGAIAEDDPFFRYAYEKFNDLETKIVQLEKASETKISGLKSEMTQMEEASEIKIRGLKSEIAQMKEASEIKIRGLKSEIAQMKEEEEVMQLIPPGLMKASTGEANLAFATTSSEPWRPRADDTKFEIYYQFPTEVKIGKFAFSAGKDDAKISFTVIGKVNCDNPTENWEKIMDVGSTMMKALSLNFWYVPKDSRKNLRCVGLKFKNKEVAVTNLRMWEESDGTLVAMRIKEKGCWSYGGYDGFANTTKSGKSCRPWADHPPVRIKNQNQGKPFPYDYSINHLNNYCRKWSMNSLSGPMCVPISQDADGPINIENCDVPQCHDEIKLEGGSCDSVRCEGRVMIKYNGFFGYVCNRDWDQRDGDVVCKYFKMKATNYENKWKLTADQAAHGIHINGLKCRGDEDNLAVCKHSGYVITNCGYADIVGVTCHI